MPALSDEAVVIGRIDYSETSQILVLLTREHGKVRAIAKGVKRSTKTRYAAGADLLDLGRVAFVVQRERSESLATLTEWKQTGSFSGLRESLARMHAAQYAAEVAAHLTEDWDPHPATFDALVATLRSLSEADDVLPHVVAFQGALLEEVGSWPRFDACVVCGREEELTHFSSFEGGLVCRHCEPGRVEKWEINEGTRLILRQGFSAAHCPSGEDRPGGAGSSGDIRRVFAALNYHISHLMGREPRLADFLSPGPARRTL